MPCMLTKLEKKILASIQGNISITSRPYLETAKKLEISEEKLLTILQSLCDRGVIRRFGATLRHQKTGFSANAMVAWKVEENRIDEAGKTMASFSFVSHCYRRETNGRWLYNLYTMIHATDEDTCRKLATELSEATSNYTYEILFSRRELKKTSMKYFSENLKK